MLFFSTQWNRLGQVFFRMIGKNLCEMKINLELRHEKSPPGLEPKPTVTLSFREDLLFFRRGFMFEIVFAKKQWRKWKRDVRTSEAGEDCGINDSNFFPPINFYRFKSELPLSQNICWRYIIRAEQLASSSTIPLPLHSESNCVYSPLLDYLFKFQEYYF